MDRVVLVLRSAVDVEQADGIVGFVEDLQYLVIARLSEPLLDELRGQVSSRWRDRVPRIEDAILIKREVLGLLLPGLRMRLVRVLIMPTDHLVLD